MNSICLGQKESILSVSNLGYGTGTVSMGNKCEHTSAFIFDSDEEDLKNILIRQYMNDILAVVRNDHYEDGTETRSEEYMLMNYSDSSKEYIKEALMNLYLDYQQDAQVLTGILMMAGSVSYDSIHPQGQIMALGLLQNKDFSVRDRAVQLYERWNSKKGINVLKGLRCDRKWLQRYVDKVIFYLERDGTD